MSLSSILALVDAAHGAATLKVAGLASAALGAPVDALVVKRDPRDAIPMVGEGLSGDLVQQIMDSAEADANAAAAAAKKVFDGWPPHVDASLTEIVGRTADVIGRVGRVHGLTVLPCGGASDSVTEAIDAALFTTGRPTLVAPLHEVQSVGTRCAIFWNDSAESARAVWGGLPFLRLAKQVTAFAVNEDFDGDDALGRLVDGLGRAGVKATAQAIEPDGSGAASQLIDAAAAMDADLVLMGAFTHSRLRELVLGGVTQSMLEGLARPTLLAH